MKAQDDFNEDGQWKKKLHCNKALNKESTQKKAATTHTYAIQRWPFIDQYLQKKG